MIFNVIWTMFLFRGAASAAGQPALRQRRVRLGRRSATCSTGSPRTPLHVLEGIGLLLHIGVMLVFLVIVLNSKHLHIFVAPLNVLFKRQPVALGAARPLDVRRQAGHPRRPRGDGRGHHPRHRLDRGLLVEGPARLRDLHRVRPLPEPVPGLEHREAALAEDADHEPAGPRVPHRFLPPGRRGQARQAARGRPRARGRGRARPGRRDRGRGLAPDRRRRSSTPTCCGPA